MPILRKIDKNGNYYQYGNTGKRYYYTAGNTTSRRQAIYKASRQADAIHANGFKGGKAKNKKQKGKGSGGRFDIKKINPPPFYDLKAGGYLADIPEELKYLHEPKPKSGYKSLIKRVIKPVNDFLKKHKLVSRGLRALDFKDSVVNHVERAGYGRRRRRRRK